MADATQVPEQRSACWTIITSFKTMHVVAHQLPKNGTDYLPREGLYMSLNCGFANEGLQAIAYAATYVGSVVLCTTSEIELC